MVTHLSNVIAAVLKRSFLFFKILFTAKRKIGFYRAILYLQRNLYKILEYCRNLKVTDSITFLWELL